MLIDNLVNIFSENIPNTATTLFNHWWQRHPLMTWMINHPVLTLIAIVFLIFLLSGLLQLIGKAGEKVWLFIFQLPWRLGQYLGKLTSHYLGWSAYKTSPAISNNQALETKIDNILEKIDYLTQQQQLILQELADLKKNSLTIKNSCSKN